MARHRRRRRHLSCARKIAAGRFLSRRARHSRTLLSLLTAVSPSRSIPVTVFACRGEGFSRPCLVLRCYRQGPVIVIYVLCYAPDLLALTSTVAFESRSTIISRIQAAQVLPTHAKCCLTSGHVTWRCAHIRVVQVAQLHNNRYVTISHQNRAMHGAFLPIFTCSPFEYCTTKGRLGYLGVSTIVVAARCPAFQF
jgi:hypothetical protein